MGATQRKHLTAFFERVLGDQEMTPTHISLYMALYQLWSYNNCISPVSISRGEAMALSKIASKVTYHKAIKSLNEKGFIKYEPSFNPFRGSQVYVLSLKIDDI